MVGWSSVASLFLGAGIAISSTMVVSKVFEQIPPPADVREMVLGVLVVQDIVAIVLVAFMSGVARGGGLSGGELAAMLGGLGALLVGFVVVGLLIVPRLIRFVVRLGQPEILVVVSAGLCFAMALIAASLGYSVALGAFIAGVLVAESGEAAEVEHRMQSLRDLFAAVFFVSIGMSVDPTIAVQNLPLALLLFAVVVLMQLVSVSIAGVLSGNGLRRSVKSGLALGQVGEFGFILAGIATAAGVVGPELQSILVTVAILTAFTTPLLLRHSVAIVSGIDHVLPSRLQHLLSLYDSWFERLRAPGEGRRTQLVRAIRVIALDTLGILVIFALTINWLPAIAHWLGSKLSLDDTLASWAVALISILLAAPLLVGVVRNALILSRQVVATVLPTDRAPAPAERVAGHMLAGMIHLAIIAGVGLPTVVVLQPVTGELWGIVLLAVAFLIAGVYLWRSAGELATELASGAEYVAAALARQASGPDDGGPSRPVLPGLEGRTAVHVGAESDAANRTLAELDVRSITGADVVAIYRVGGAIVLPTGHERLLAGDLLAITGSAEAIAEARALFARAARPESEPESRLTD